MPVRLPTAGETHRIKPQLDAERDDELGSAASTICRLHADRVAGLVAGAGGVAVVSSGRIRRLAAPGADQRIERLKHGTPLSHVPRTIAPRNSSPNERRRSRPAVSM